MPGLDFELALRLGVSMPARNAARQRRRRERERKGDAEQCRWNHERRAPRVQLPLRRGSSVETHSAMLRIASPILVFLGLPLRPARK
jgi:hypothetical protein